ncbi:MAG: SagB/ThcOx family dehydrogenase [Lentimicrobiaceae bacterium]|nr:SagB/ThcOx family dehydrogenase [Lentimicrobiaceae bacterium]
MKKIYLLNLFILIVFSGCHRSASTNEGNNLGFVQTDDTQLTYILPAPNTDGTISVEKALAHRRSHRQFTNEALSPAQLSQILWAAYGITEPRENPAFLRGGFRTAPSAGALYPFEIYAIVGNVKDIESGVYKYISEENKIVRMIEGNVREQLCVACWGQKMVQEAPATIFYSAIYSRTTNKYGDRGRERYVCMDLGHSAQNIYLQAEAMQLGTCAIGAFVDEEVSKVLQLPDEEEPLYLMPVGYWEEK